MCGDTNCPSCGPAQGFDPQCERLSEWVSEVLLAAVPDVDGEIANRVIGNILYMAYEDLARFDEMAASWARRNYENYRAKARKMREQAAKRDYEPLPDGD
jgi:hypothetical protein